MREVTLQRRVTTYNQLGLQSLSVIYRFFLGNALKITKK